MKRSSAKESKKLILFLRPFQCSRKERKDRKEKKGNQDGTSNPDGKVG
jgi:hypothetical protein